MPRTQIESGVSRPKVPEDKKRIQTGWTVPASLAAELERIGAEMGGVKPRVLNERALRWFIEDMKNGSPRATTDPQDQWSEPGSPES